MARSHHQYSSELKQRLVEEIEAGQLSLREAARDARTSVAMVQVWLREYGRFQPKRDIVEVVMKSEQDRIAALEKALAEAHLTLQVYDELITQANKRYKTDFQKGFGTPPLAPSAAPGLGRPSARSATSSGSPAMPITNANAEATPSRRRTR
jgi:transposase-like protein